MAIIQPHGVVGVQDLPVKYRHVEVAEEEFTPEPGESATNGSAGYVSPNDTLLLPEQGIDLRDYLTGLEKDLIRQALDDCGGVVARAAERLSIRRTTLRSEERRVGVGE